MISRRIIITHNGADKDEKKRKICLYKTDKLVSEKGKTSENLNTQNEF